VLEWVLLGIAALPARDPIVVSVVLRSEAEASITPPMVLEIARQEIAY
jgi:hypothetical protein